MVYEVWTVMTVHAQAYGVANQGYAAQPDMRSPLHGQLNTNQVCHTHLDLPLAVCSTCEPVRLLQVGAV